MSKKNYSSWAEEIDFEDLNLDSDAYNLPMGILEDVKEALIKSSSRTHKKNKVQKCKRECWN